MGFMSSAAIREAVLCQLSYPAGILEAGHFVNSHNTNRSEEMKVKYINACLKNLEFFQLRRKSSILFSEMSLPTFVTLKS